MDYKETLHMPKTGFEMRGNLPKKEPGIQKSWQENHLFEKMLEQREDAKPFILHDGPPYANGDIHLGHALNKILKDVINRSHYMEGYKIPYIPGWDTHGLPIETAVTKLGYDRKKMPLAEFRKICYDYAMEQVEKQKQGFLSLGSIGDYDHPYITLTKDFEAEQIKIFGKMAMKGLIYKGLKPVYWSPSSESALAEAEVEYKDIKSPTIYVKFQVKDGKGVLDTDTYFVIWTTTPWTIPANLGIAVHPQFTYALVNTDKGKLIMLEELVETLCPKFECKEYEVIKTFKGKEFEYITCTHPLYPERESLLMLADYVTADAGTGCVHTAPAFGADDFYIGAKYGLPVYCNVDEQGKMMASCGEWLEGQYVLDANKTVTMKLDELGALLNLTFITHAYPHDWRTKKPIIFRATTQWFASIDKIRDELLNEIHSIKWVPSWGEQRMHNMIADRTDWCISRQRAWGVPIPIIYGEDDTPLMDEAIFDHVSDLFREYGSNVWFEREAKDLLPEGYTSEHSPNGIFRKEVDTMDVWFDSGSSHTPAMLKRGLGYPADLYFEGSDQYRGWFNSSLIVGTAVYGKAPYKQVLSHGFVMDEKGVKMSKSQWNAVAPSEITKKYGTSLEEDTFKVNCYGAGGQSFGAFIPQGLTLHLYGDSNDYFGKGLSGGKLIVVPPKDSTIKPEDNIIIGNVALYGATSGEVYINGIAGERFAVRNSGAHAVVEGIGDHGLEYMTGGMVIVLGKTGRNFAAGMSGGIAYVYDPDNTFYEHVNKELVEYKNVKSRYDEDQLKEMIQKHYQYTNSNVAKKILDDFGNEVAHFKKVVPHDYKRMMSLISSFEQQGLTNEQAKVEAFNAFKKGM